MRRTFSTFIATACFATSTFILPDAAFASEEKTITATLVGGYSPRNVTVDTGTTVTWRNGEAVPPLSTGPTGQIAIKHHVVSSDGTFDSGELAPGQVFTMTFTEPASISYVCKLHPNLMAGSLTVEGEPYVPPATEKTIEIVEPSSETSSWGFDPDEITVSTGTTITWRNTGSIDHTVTADDGSFDSGDLGPGESFKKTFEKSVAITYICTPHPWMKGTLIVAAPGQKPPVVKPKPATGNPGGGGSSAPIVQPDRVGNEPATFQARIVEGSLSDPDSWGYTPASLTVRQGDTIVWTNDGSVDHTVTAADGSFDSGMLASGATFSLTLDDLGTFTYSCTPHPWMKGAFAVIEAGADPSVVELPEVRDPVLDPPTTGGTDSDPGVGSGGGSHEASSSGSWSHGNVPLAAATSAGLLGIGLLILIPFALEFRRIRRRGGAPHLAEPESAEPELTVEPEVVDLRDEIEAEVREPILVGAGAPLPATRRVATVSASKPRPATARASAATKKAAPKKTTAKKAAPKKSTASKAASSKTASPKTAAAKASRKKIAGTGVSGTRSSKS